MRWRYFDVTDGVRTWSRRRRLTVPRVGERSAGYVVVRVESVSGRTDSVEALVHVERTNAKSPDPPERIGAR